MATIVRRQNNKGEVRYTARVRLQGRQTAKTFSTLKAAESWARKTEGEIETGKFQKSRERGRLGSVGQLIKRFTEDYLEEYADTRNMEQRLEWWTEQLGKIPLRDLTAADLAAARDELAKQTNRAGEPLSASTIHRYLAAISTVLQRAVQDYQLLDSNPARNVRRPKPRKAAPQFIQDKADLDALRAAAAADRDPMALPLILTTLATGMRKGELVRLRWPEVNLKTGILEIPKTKNGNPRTVRLAGAALEALERWSKVRRLADDRVFPPMEEGADGTARINKLWERLRKTTPGTDVKFHALRHTAGTWLSQEGFHPVDVARVLGHKSLAMALVYQQLTDQRRDEIATTLAGAMFGDGA